MNDFDFLVGTWDVKNRWRKDFLDPSADWMEEFPSVLTSTTHLDGWANFSESTYPTRGFGAVTFRMYDPDTELWSDYWAAHRHPGLITEPVIGRFTDGRGEFHGTDVQDGVPVQVRFIWTDISHDSAQWEQAMSTDDGKTWVSNWTESLTRRA